MRAGRIGMFAVAALALLITMAIALVRLFLGPSVYDRVLAVNMFGTKMVLLIAVTGFLTGRPDFLDISLAYALINFISTIAILKFFRYWAVEHPGENNSELASTNISGVE